MDKISLDDVATLLQRGGVEAHVEHTGGGVMCLFAGPTWTHPADGTRYAAVAGPGEHDDGANTVDLRDFSVSGDGTLGEAWQLASHPDPSSTAEQVAEVVAGEVRVQVAAMLRAAADLGIDVGTTVADADLTGDELDRVAAVREWISVNDAEGVLFGFRGWDVRPYAQRDGEPTEVDVVLCAEFDHDLPVYEGSAHDAWNFLSPGRYDVRVAGLPLVVAMDVTEDWSGVLAPTPVP